MTPTLAGPASLADRLGPANARPRDLKGPLDAIERDDASPAVLDITEWFGATSGGIRTYLLEKAAFVAQRPSLRQVLVVPGAVDSQADAGGVRLYRLRGPRIPGQAPYRFMLSAQRVSAIISHERPDVIEVGSPLVSPWLAIRAARDADIPLISFYHSNMPRMFGPRGGPTDFLRRSVQQAAWRYTRRLHQHFAMTIVTSAYSEKDLAREGVTNVARVPLGVDLDQFSPHLRADSHGTRHRFALPDGPLAGFVGRFASEKELGMVLDAWTTVERTTGARLVLVGAGPLESALRAHPYGERVYFVPFQTKRDQLADLLACFDIYLAPGRIETFGLSSLEALASGTPVLAANAGGVAEQVEQSGAGRCFVAGYSGSFAEEACALLRDDLNSLGAKGRRYAEREHSWSTVFGRLFDVYRSVLDTRL